MNEENEDNIYFVEGEKEISNKDIEGKNFDEQKPKKDKGFFLYTLALTWEKMFWIWSIFIGYFK